MKKIQKYIMIALVGVLATLTAGCQKEPLAEEDFSKDYDIPWVVSTITNITPLTARTGETITITGTNLDNEWIAPNVEVFDFVCFCMKASSDAVKIGANAC